MGFSRVLDFSFKEAREPYDLLRLEPTHYVRHLAAPVAKEAPRNLSEEVRAARNASSDKFVTIKARRRDGEVEQYGFVVSKDDGSGAGGGGGGAGGGGGGGAGLGALGGAGGSSGGDAKKIALERELAQLVSNLRTKVVCDSVRLCNNALTDDAASLLPVLRNLVVNHYLRVRWLDLSNNELTGLPPEISQLPLQALHMHGNRVAAWDSLERELPLLTRLQFFTLFGNPIAENAATFRPRALGILLHVPKKLLPFKGLDFVPVTLVDVQGAATFLRTNPRALDVTRPRQAAELGGAKSKATSSYY